MGTHTCWLLTQEEVVEFASQASRRACLCSTPAPARAQNIGTGRPSTEETKHHSSPDQKFAFSLTASLRTALPLRQNISTIYVTPRSQVGERFESERGLAGGSVHCDNEEVEARPVRVTRHRTRWIQ